MNELVIKHIKSQIERQDSLVRSFSNDIIDLEEKIENYRKKVDAAAEEGRLWKEALDKLIS